MRSPVAVSLFTIFLLVASVSGDSYTPANPAPANNPAPAAKVVVNTNLNTCDADVITACDTRCKAHCDNGVGNGPDCRPGRARFANDDPSSTGPGAPGARQKILYATSTKGDNTIVGGEDVSVGSTFKTICHDRCEDEGRAACRLNGRPDVPRVEQEDVKRVACRRDGFNKCHDKCKAHCNNGLGNGPDCRPGRARFNNDDLVSATLGNGGAKRKIAYDNNIKGDDTTTVAGSDAIVVSTFKHLTKCHDDCEDEVETSCTANPTVAPIVEDKTTHAAPATDAPKPVVVEHTQPAKVETTQPKPVKVEEQTTQAKPVVVAVEQTKAAAAAEQPAAPKPVVVDQPKPVLEVPHPPVAIPVATTAGPAAACPVKERAIRVRRENCDNGAQLKKVIDTLKCKVSTLLAAIETLNAAKQQQQATVTKTVDTVVAEAVKAAVQDVVVKANVNNGGAATGAYGNVGTVQVVRAKSVRRAKSVQRAKSVRATAGGYGGQTVTVAKRGGSRRGGSKKVVKVAAAAAGAYGAAAAIKKVRGHSRRGGSKKGGYTVKRRGGSNKGRRGGDRYGGRRVVAHGRRRGGSRRGGYGRRGGSRKGRRGVSHKGRRGGSRRRGGYGRRGGSRKGRRTGGDRYNRGGRRGVSRKGGYRGGRRTGGGGDRYNRSHARVNGGRRTGGGGDRYNRSHARTGGAARGGRTGYGGGAARRTGGGGARRGGDRY